MKTSLFRFKRDERGSVVVEFAFYAVILTLMLIGVIDFGLAYAWAHSRTLRLADGPDEVHRAAVAKLELRRQTPVWLHNSAAGRDES